MNSAEIKAALRKRYAPPEWAIMFEVRDQTGYSGQTRSADAIAMNLWPSRGLAVHGFEIKVSRSDWTRELAKPDKSAPIQQFCDHWWIVTPPGIVKAGELPPTWGVLELHGERFSIHTDAPKLQAHPLSRGFLASMLRREHEVQHSEIDVIVEKRVQAARKDDKERLQREIELRTRRASELLEKVDQIERLTGIDIRKWTPGEEFASVIRMALSSGLMSAHSGISAIRERLESSVEQMKKFEQVLSGEEPKKEAA